MRKQEKERTRKGRPGLVLGPKWWSKVRERLVKEIKMRGIELMPEHDLNSRQNLLFSGEAVGEERQRKLVAIPREIIGAKRAARDMFGQKELTEDANLQLRAAIVQILSSPISQRPAQGSDSVASSEEELKLEK